jgi:cupin 2 domain-containing protein
VFAGIPHSAKEEYFEPTLHHSHLRIERIVSHGHASPPGFWYDQEEAEWVLVLKGKALLSHDDLDLPLV